LEMLEWQLQNYCRQIQVCALCKNADEGITAIRQYQPHLIFLDIEMPTKNGFEVLLAFPKPGFDVIFTTAYDQFAVKAFKFSAFDFLLKPIDADDLVLAIHRFEKKQHQTIAGEQLQNLLQQYQQPGLLPLKIPFTTNEGIIFIKHEHIVYCEAVSNYTHIYLLDKPKLVVSKTLKDIEEILLPFKFYRVHNSYLINLLLINKFVKAEGGSVEMSNGTQVPVSRQKKEAFIEMLLKK
ncbi:MAG: LytR/AlgR family response regulator transcription factor, partial [Chitinophagaceae bacterium]